MNAAVGDNGIGIERMLKAFLRINNVTVSSAFTGFFITPVQSCQLLYIQQCKNSLTVTTFILILNLNQF